ERDRGADHEPAHEPATRLVVPGEEEPHRADEHRGEDHLRGEGADHVAAVHGTGSRSGAPSGVPLDATGRSLRRTARASATDPMAAVASTVISPIVSRPRKSTRITLTTLRPCASGSARSIISCEIGVAVRA